MIHVFVAVAVAVAVAFLDGANAFAPPMGMGAAVSVRMQATNSNSNKEQPKDDVEDIMSVTRRQILGSMLAAAAGYPSLLSVPPASASAATATATATKDSSAAVQEGILSTTDIMVPPLDDRAYEFMTLPNGLRVLLCSDPTSNEAAAAMDVHVGACSDPDSVPGLAHFQEHMLFLGTKDYPKESSFEAFLATNGGSSNAYSYRETYRCCSHSQLPSFFGCRVVAIPARTKRPSKLENDAHRGVFLGFCRTGKNAIYYDTDTKTVKTKRLRRTGAVQNKGQYPSTSAKNFNTLAQ